MKQALLWGMAFLGSCAGESLRPRPSLREWLEICADHGFSQVEMAMAMGREAPEIAQLLGRSGIRIEGRPAPKAFTIEPYPGGRHPRAGFLEGAVDPQRDTKFSLFLPSGGYVVVDCPEALWRDVEALPRPTPRLIFLAHTHLKTYWEERGLKPEKLDWERTAEGGLEERRRLPDGVEIRARVSSAPDGAEIELRLKNGTTAPISNPWAQVCVMLKGATGFEEQTRENKVLLEAEGVAAVRSRDGKRWIATAFDRPRKVWQNPPVPCIHSEPSWPDLPPGEEAVAHGRIFYWEGSDFSAEVACRIAAGTLTRCR